MSLPVRSVSHSELMALVDKRRNDVRAFLGWSEQHETSSWSMYLVNRPDIREARQAAALYDDEWWGVVVFTCFGSLTSTRLVRNTLPGPVDSNIAAGLLDTIDFVLAMVGHHRKQQALTGAKKALIAACAKQTFLRDVIFASRSFDDRYRLLRRGRLDRWGRTTCFDLLLRMGALGIGGERYQPEIAYLAGSTGPRAGFHAVWGREVTDENAPWCEGLLQAWHKDWAEVVARVGARWSGTPYAPGDLENSLCLYQERH